MSSLKDLVSRGVRLIVSETPDSAAEATPTPSARERDIPASEFEAEPPQAIAQSQVPADVEDFGAVYQEAGIELPAARLRHRQGRGDAGEQAAGLAWPAR